MGRKDWTECMCSKCGLLTALSIVPAAIAKELSMNINRHGTIFLCKCECGAEIYVQASEFARGNKTTCGKKECRAESAKRKRALNWCRRGSPILESDFEQLLGENARSIPAIVSRLKPKYYCIHPAQECVISSTCNICCWECDKPCKSCNNSPEKCGAERRQE